MEKSNNRREYVNALPKVMNLVDDQKVNDLINDAKKHTFFENHSNTIEKLETIEAKKLYLLTELTHKRAGCRAIIEILEDNKQKKAAKKLRKYNTSLLIDILNEPYQKIDIEVLKTKIPDDGSAGYLITRNPRGKFIIIDNVKGLFEKKYPLFSFIESQRFKHVFEELYFEVEIWQDLPVNDIEERLKKVYISPFDQAFGLMIVTHGENENVYGFKACKEIESKKISDVDLTIVNNDQMEISDVVQIFSQIEKIPKFFIFDCCRGKADLTADEIQEFKNELNRIETRDKDEQNSTNVKKDDIMNKEYNTLIKKYEKKWVDQSNAFIIYSCSEGYNSNLCGCISAFGHAFSHALARYACEESLQCIMARTTTLMEEFKKLPTKIYKHYSPPEFKLQCAKRLLLFNAGAEEEVRKTKMIQNIS